VRVQLLGQYPEWLAENAARAVEMGSYGIFQMLRRRM
jgi:tRNA-dihydrouridine synthase C